jgi:hypothetical protein
LILKRKKKLSVKFFLKMKRGRREKNEELRIGVMQFKLIPGLRKVPQEKEDFDGHYYQGSIEIVAAPSCPQFRGAVKHARIYDAQSCSSCFIYGTRNAFFDVASDTVVIPKRPHPKFGGPKDVNMVTVESYVSELSIVDLHDIRREISKHIESDKLKLFMLHKLEEESSSSVVDTTQFLAQPFAKQSGGYVTEYTELVRLPTVASIRGYLKPSSLKQLHGLSNTQREALAAAVITHPWTLLWNSPVKNITQEQFYLIMRNTNNIRVPQHIQYALAIYFRIAADRKEGRHTLFSCEDYWRSVIPAMPNRDEMMRWVWNYLSENALDAFGGEDNNHYVAMKRDAKEARLTMAALCKIRRNAFSGDGDCELRGNIVSHIPPKLTARQEEIARHIMTHWLTVVEGLPGTGKTVIIEWAYSHYRNVMLCGFVGMLVKMLRRRNGGNLLRRLKEDEIAFTIHALLDKASRKQQQQDWFAKWEVLIVDEFSNVSARLFSELLQIFPRLKKVIVVGDHRQLKPIKHGDPMGDLIAAFGTQVLTENLRVEKDLKALQDAPLLIHEGKARQIQFEEKEGPIGFVHREDDPVPLLIKLFSKIMSLPDGARSLLNSHVVLLLNTSADGRHAINQACEEAWARLSMIAPSRGAVEIRKGLSLYVGAKITFSKNYNHPLHVEFEDSAGLSVQSEPVANGELYIVKRIWRMAKPGRGVVMQIVDEESECSSVVPKQVWIDAAEGISPAHVELGFASTTYKIQGQECPYLIFYNRTQPEAHWTRPHALVAVSRAKRRCWIVGTPQEFFAICDRPDPIRRTCFSYMLRRQSADFFNAPLPFTPAPMVPRDRLQLMTKKKKKV